MSAPGAGPRSGASEDEGCAKHAPPIRPHHAQPAKVYGKKILKICKNLCEIKICLQDTKKTSLKKMDSFPERVNEVVKFYNVTTPLLFKTNKHSDYLENVSFCGV